MTISKQFKSYRLDKQTDKQTNKQTHPQTETTENDTIFATLWLHGLVASHTFTPAGLTFVRHMTATVHVLFHSVSFT